MNIKKIIKEVLPYLIIIVIVILIKTYVFSLIRVNGPSMEETLLNKDIMILDKISYRFGEIKRFDIVVIDLGDEYIIKRVIGLPGEKVSYKNNNLYINGQKVKTNFKHSKTENFETTNKIPENQYFVLGDNRLNSTDSRIIGTIKKEKIIGHARYTILPFSRFGSKK